MPATDPRSSADAGPLSQKPPDYFAGDRTALLDWAGGRHARVLDVGCGTGANAGWFRRHGAVEIVGVEIDGASAALAREVYDRVVCGAIEDAMDGLAGPFDLILCADVLEHLVDPWSVVRGLAGVAGPATTLAVSMPNIRFAPALLRIAFGSGFRYEGSGIFDATHLRFFTRRDMDALLRQGGWVPRRWSAPPFERLGTIRRGLQRLTSNRSDEWLAGQLYVVARLSRSR